MHYLSNQKIRTATATVVVLGLMLLNLPLTAQDNPGQMPQQEQMPPQDQAPGQDEMPSQRQDPNPQDQMQIPQQQQNISEDYSEDELKQFVDANKEATKVQQKTQQEMISVIEGEGLDVQTFNEIMTSQQDPQQEVAVSDGELEKFNKAAEKVIEIQQNMETEVVGAIESTGMDVNKYSEIMLAYQSSPVVQEKVHKLLEGQGNGN